MSEVDDRITQARATMERISADYRGGGAAPSRARASQVRDIGRRLTRVAIAETAIVVAAVVIGFIHPIGLFGLLLMVVLMIVAGIFLLSRPAEPPVRVERLAQSDLRALPAQTERWLAAQRPALPAPAAQLVDRIGARLDTLSPQLARVGNDTPEAGEVRKLVAEQLPAFLADYARVPAPLRNQARNGRTPDMELVDGLKLIEQEIGDMTERLAAGDLDQLATRGRYLEMRYKDEDAQ